MSVLRSSGFSMAGISTSDSSSLSGSAVASSSAEESEGPSAREAIPGVGNFGIQTRPDLSGGGPATLKISTDDEIK